MRPLCQSPLPPMYESSGRSAFAVMSGSMKLPPHHWTTSGKSPETSAAWTFCLCLSPVHTTLTLTPGCPDSKLATYALKILPSFPTGSPPSQNVKVPVFEPPPRPPPPLGAPRAHPARATASRVAIPPPNIRLIDFVIFIDTPLRCGFATLTRLPHQNGRVRRGHKLV